MTSPTPAEGDVLRAQAEVVSSLLLKQPSWALRRVETSRFIDDETLRVRVSIDLDLQQQPAWIDLTELVTLGLVREVLLPFALPAKRDLEDFDLNGPDGKPLPLLTKKKTTPLAVEVLVVLAENVLGHSKAEPFRELFTRIVAEDIDEARRALDQLRSRGAGAADPSEAQALSALFADQSFVYLLDQLSERFMALAVMPSTDVLAHRSILKYSYVTATGWQSGWRSWPGRFGVVGSRMVVPLALVCSSESYHVDIEAPDALQILECQIVRPAESGQPPQILVEAPPLAHRAHVSVSQPFYRDAARYELRLRFLPQRRGFVRGSLFAAAFCLTAMVVVLAFHTRIAASPTSTASLLLTLPGLITAWLSRPSEHPTATRLYFGLRLLLGLSAVSAWGVAAGIALNVSARPLLWLAVAGVFFSALSLGVVGRAFVVASKPGQPG